MSIAFFAHCGTRQSHTLSSGTRELQSICTMATLAKFGSRKTKLDPWSVGCQSQRGCLRKLRNNSAKGQHEYPVSAAFAFNFRWIALSGLYRHSLASYILQNQILLSLTAVEKSAFSANGHRVLCGLSALTGRSCTAIARQQCRQSSKPSFAKTKA